MAPRQTKRKSADVDVGPSGSYEKNGLAVLHRASFVEWKPSPIVDLACCRDGSMTAAVRENGDVELYETATLHQFQVDTWIYDFRLSICVHACMNTGVIFVVKQT